MEKANEYLKNVFIPKYNKQFGVVPKVLEPAYRPLNKEQNLRDILCRIEERTIGTGDCFNYNNDKFLIINDIRIPLKGRMIEIKTYRDGTKKYFLMGEEVKVAKLERRSRAF